MLLEDYGSLYNNDVIKRRESIDDLIVDLEINTEII
jgi:hypothetical protein